MEDIKNDFENSERTVDQKDDNSSTRPQGEQGRNTKNNSKTKIPKEEKERPLPSGEETNIPEGMGPDDNDRMKK
ncbi:hypothetical protein [Sphingobacterium sp.]|uniref:hypothetical protein n=1 Tax=Sphingobacterium sp. TaxID=341027 RepID=UPI0028B21663|nr:hypothetical protein [Sphingobacterium sp.]